MWTVLESVEEMDLSAFYAAYRADGHGRPAYEPSLMVALVVVRVFARESVVAEDRAGVSGGRCVSGDRGEPGA